METTQAKTPSSKSRTRLARKVVYFSRPAEAKLVEQAAKIQDFKVSDFMRRASVKEARRIVAEQRKAVAGK